METLNQIEKQLEDRSIKELEEIVDTFLSSVQEIKNKYGGSNYYSYVNKDQIKGTSCIEPYVIKNHLLYMLKENHLQSMLGHKSKELLSKLDLMS
jgi:hypothetical protein